MPASHCEEDAAHAPDKLPTKDIVKRVDSAEDSAMPRIATTSRRFVIAAAVAVGVVSFLATELLRYLLVPDIGRMRERLLAEFLTALILSALTAKLIQIARERHRLMIARMQVIAEMNHHIRNALSPISLSLDATENQHLKSVVSDAVDRIDWALREILPRELPLAAEQRHKLGYFQKHPTV
jgi:signal transduction histidine kinase